MLREIWDRLLGRERDGAVARESEREQMSPAERRVAEGSIEDFQADEFVSERLGGIDPQRLSGEDEPPRN